MSESEEKSPHKLPMPLPKKKDCSSSYDLEVNTNEKGREEEVVVQAAEEESEEEETDEILSTT